MLFLFVISVCQVAIGRPLGYTQHSHGDQRTNIITGKPFPCDSHLVAWEYYRIKPEYAGFLDVFRPSIFADTTNYTLIHSTAVPPQPIGRQILKLPEMLPVKAGDVIGMHFPSEGRHFVANIQPSQLAGHILEMDAVLLCGEDPNLQLGDAIGSNQCSDIARTYTVRAIIYQNWTLGRPGYL